MKKVTKIGMIATIALVATPSIASDLDLNLLAASFVLSADLAEADGKVTVEEREVIDRSFGRSGRHFGLLTFRKMFTMSLEEAQETWKKAKKKDKEEIFQLFYKVAGSDHDVSRKEAAWLKSYGKGLGIKGDPKELAKQFSYEVSRSEVPTNIKAIKTAQIQYESAYSAFVNCDEYPPRGGSKAKQWIVSSSGGFETINWQPDGDVRGSYSVKTTGGGSGQLSDFTIIGVIDADGDGEYATYTATKSTNPTSPTTRKDVY